MVAELKGCKAEAPVPRILLELKCVVTNPKFTANKVPLFKFAIHLLLF